LLLIPKDYLIIKGDISVAVVLKSLWMIALLGLVFRRLFRSLPAAKP